MAPDNVTLDPGAAGDEIAADEIAGVKHQRVKAQFGADGTATDVSAANPLPVVLTGTQAATPVTDNGGTLSVDDGGGTLTVDDGGGSLTVDGAVSVSGAVDTELTTADLDTGAGTDTRGVVGLVRAESGGATLVGSANPLPVTGPLTDTQLRALAVAVSGPLTDAQLRAVAVPVSGVLTDGQLRATPVPVSGTVTANAGTGPFPVSDNGGSLTVDGTVTGNQGTPGTQANAWPTKLSNGTINADVLAAAPGSDTGQPAVAVRVVSQLGAGSGLAGTIDAPADNKAPTSAQHVQAFLSCFDGTNWDMVRGDTTNGVDVDVTRLPALPTGANTIGKVDQGAPAVIANAWPVKLSDGTNNPAVKAASTPAVAADPALVVAISPGTPVVIKEDQPTATTATWTSATSVNTAATATVTNYGSASISIQVPTTTTAGVITLEVSDDGGTTYYPAGAVRLDNAEQENAVTLAATPGIALNRMWQVGLDGITNLRARLSTVIVGAGSVLVRISPSSSSIDPFVTTRSRKVPTYSAFYRVAARAYTLANTPAINTRKQYATIHHAAAAVKTVRLRRVEFVLINTSIGTEANVELVRITAAPATGNPAITPALADSSDPAVEATCLALPTTAGTEGARWNARYHSTGATAAPAAANVPAVPTWQTLLDGQQGDDEAKFPTIRAGVLEGWAVTLDVTTSSAVAMMVRILFTEEPA